MKKIILLLLGILFTINAFGQKDKQKTELLLYLPLNGSVLDCSSNENKGFLTGNAKFSKDKTGNFLQLTGGEQCKDGIQINLKKRPKGQGLSLAFDASFDLARLKKDKLFIVASSRLSNLSENAGILLSMNDRATKQTFRFEVGSKQQRRGWEMTIPANVDVKKWHHYAFTYNGSYIAMFIDGKLIKREKMGSPADYIPGKYPLKIGHRGCSSYCGVGGKIKNFTLYQGIPDWNKIWNKPVKISADSGDMLEVFSLKPSLYRYSSVAAPVIDGKIDDKCWKNAEWASGFSDILQARLLPENLNSSFAISCDDKNLYFAASGKFDEIASIRPRALKHDDAVWREECFDINIMELKKKRIYQFIVSTKGVIADSDRSKIKSSNMKWNCNNVKAAAQINKDCWTMELAIPLKDIGLKAGDDFKLNVGRTHFSVGGVQSSSAWMTTFGNFADPTRMGIVTREKKAIPQVKIVLKNKKIILNKNKFYKVQLTDTTTRKISSQNIKLPYTLNSGQTNFILRTYFSEDFFIEALLERQKKRGAFDIILYGKFAAAQTVYLYGENPRLNISLSWLPELANCNPNAPATIKLKLANGQKLATFRISGGTTKRLLSFKSDLAMNKKIAVKAQLKQGNYSADFVFYVKRIPAQANQIYVDADGALIDNQKKVLPFGFLGIDERWGFIDYAKKRSGKYNVSYKQDNPPYTCIKSMLDYAEKCGIKVAVAPVSNRSYKKFLSNSLDSVALEDTKKMVNKFKNHPGLFGWYLADEPTGSGISIKTIAKLYQTISALDPNHPCILLNNSISGIKRYGSFTDALCPDPYALPLKKGKRQAIRPFIRYLMSFIKEAVKQKRAAWICMQLFDYAHFAPELKHTRKYDFFELRSEAYSMLLAGGKGCISFVPDQVILYPVLDLGYEAIGRELNAIEEYVLTGENKKISCDNKEILTSCWALGEKLLIVAVNSSSTKTINTSLSAKYLKGKFHVLAESRTISAKNNTIKDTFSPIQVRVYMTDLPEVETLSSVENRITLAQAKIDKRNVNNVLYWKNGGSAEGAYPMLRALNQGLNLKYRFVRLDPGKAVILKFAQKEKVKSITIWTSSAFAKHKLTDCKIFAKNNEKWQLVKELSKQTGTELDIPLNINFETKEMKIMNTAEKAISFRLVKVLK